MCRWSVAVSTDKSVPLFHCLSAPRCRVGGTRATAVSPCPAPLQSLVNTAGVGSRLQLRSLQPATRFTIPPLIGRISRCGRTSAATLYICGLQLPGTAGNHRPAGGEREPESTVQSLSCLVGRAAELNRSAAAQTPRPCTLSQHSTTGL